VLTKFATALLAITLSAGSVHAMTGRFWSHSLSSAHFPTCSEVWLKQNVYAALRTDRACLSFVVRGFIATPSMVCAGSSYSDAVNRIIGA